MVDVSKSVLTQKRRKNIENSKSLINDLKESYKIELHLKIYLNHQKYKNNKQTEVFNFKTSKQIL